MNTKHWWFSGRILACHAGGPGSIPGQCIRFLCFLHYFCLCDKFLIIFIPILYYHILRDQVKSLQTELKMASKVGKKNSKTDANRPFARWRHFTTTTRILLVFLFIFKFGSPSEV